ncbi:GIY-YIG nuclease family protein [candidate division KSB1 bacterium]|nr:GIY-YIG nuclease family protein [candidate division KSB1 bacterium]
MQSSERPTILYRLHTSNLRKRIGEHNKGETKSTMNRRPLILIYFEACMDKRDAMRREKYLKSGNGKIYLKNRLRKYFEKANV